MKRNQISVTIIVIVLCGAAMSFAQTTGNFFDLTSIKSIFAAGENSDAKNPTAAAAAPLFSAALTPRALKSSIPGTSKTEVPEHILYESVFRMVVSSNEQARLQQENGEPVTQYSTYFKDEADLTDKENEMLSQTASDYSREIKIVDEQAEIVIEQLRQQHPAGTLPKGQLIKPTAELLSLQEQKEKLVSRYREHLRDLLGNDRFNEFDAFVKGSFAAGFSVTPVSSISQQQEVKEEK